MRYASALWGNVKAYFSTFLSLLDTPSTYTESEGKFVKVKTDGSGLEFADTPGEANVQSDWNQADTEQDDFIKNKPFIPTFKAIGDIYFLHGNASDITNYKKALTDLPDDAEGTVTGTANSTSGEVLIKEFATDSGFPGVTSIPAGYWIFEPYAKIDTLDGVNTLKIIAYKRDSLGTETELFNIEAEITGTSPALISIIKESEEITLEATDRLVFKYYILTTSATDRTATLYYEGETNQSRIKLPTDSQVQSDWNEENEDSPAFIKNKPEALNGEDGEDAYVYIAYASDDQGTGFTTTFNPLLDYIAIKTTTTEIPTPTAADFAGLWKNYKGADGADGADGQDASDSFDVYIDFTDADELVFVYNCPAALKFTQQISEGSAATLSPVLNTSMAQFDKLTVTAAGVGLIILKGELL